MIQRFTLRTAAVGLAVSGLLALAACGGDDDGSSDSTAATTTEQTSAVTSAPSGTDTTVAGGADTTVAGGTATTTGGGGALSADCKQLAQEFTAALGGAANPTADPGQIADAFSRLAESVPADLKDDVEVVGDALGKYAEVYSRVAGDDPASAVTHPEVLAVFQELATPEYTAASQAVSTYFSETCKTG